MSVPPNRRVALVAILSVFALFACRRQAETPASSASSPAASPAAATPTASVPAPEKINSFQAACEAARQLSNPGQRSREFGRALAEWLARDPEAALAYVRQLPPGAEFTQGLLLALDALGRSDPDRALALARELVATREQRAIYSSLFAQWAARDLNAAVSRLALVPPGDGREHALRAVADEWTRIDSAAALAWAQSLEPADRAPALETVLGALAGTDPLRSIELAQKSLTGSALDRTMATALHRLTATDARAAAALVSLLPPGETQSLAAFEVARSLATGNPSEAIAWINTLPEGGIRRVALNNVFDIWAARDPGSAGNYVGQMSPGEEQNSAAEHLARILAAKDPQNAIAWARTLAEGARDLAVVSAVSAWAQRDPAAAARWAATVPDGALRDGALDGALSYWVMSDVDSARGFVAGLAGDAQVRAAAALAPSLAQADPVSALAWSQSLSLPAARDAALDRAFARWLGNAPVAAKAWLATANLPPEVKSRLLQPASK